MNVRLYELYISRDFGVIFEKITDHVVEAMWIPNHTSVLYIANKTLAIIDVSINLTEIINVPNVTRFNRIRNDFLILEGFEPFEKTDILRILHLDINKDKLLTIIDAHDSGLKFDSILLKKYKEDNFCVPDPLLNATESIKRCPEGFKALTKFNGFVPLDPDVCAPRPKRDDEDSQFYEYCISYNFSVRIFIFSKHSLYINMLDHKGDYLPGSIFKIYSLPMNITRDTPISYDLNRKEIYVYDNHIFYRLNETNRTFSSENISLYQFGFDVISIQYDYLNSQMFVLDVNHRLFVVSLKTNYIKLLSQNVTSFKFHLDSLSIDYITDDKICYYTLYSTIICLDINLKIKKFIYSPKSKLHIILLDNSTLFVTKYSSVDNSINYEVIFVK
ncbi:hypothetical protein RF11_04964 [Thelohanellus kitauei]|uniref:Uncharacterized protein n=1 Tax=Thelohanellus kitauei TaxID=669202 RepID=A0A0C2MNA9_THEKT|nr:hypothetical protein RF11_04964 [Thelohanellus kitauei]